MQGFQHYLLLIYYLSCFRCSDDRLPVAMKSIERWQNLCESIVFCNTCTMSSLKKFRFAFSCADELLVVPRHNVVLGNYTLFILPQSVNQSLFKAHGPKK